MKKLFALLLLSSIALHGQGQKRMPHYKLTPVPAANVTLTDSFWKPRIETAFHEGFDWVTLHFDPNNGGYRTFRESQRRDTVKVEPVTTFESIKVLEAAGEYLKYNEDPDMEAYMDRCIDHWVLSQDKSGYFTGICLGDQQVFGHVAKGRWNNLQYSHELYGVGHLLEAALSYAEATGKTKILEAALRATDQVFSIFGPDKRQDVPGHEEIERAFTRYYEATGDKRFLDLARFFIDERGDHTTRDSYGEYAQDHLPFIEQRHVSGHGVRGAYLYIGATDVVGATGDEGYRTAIDSIWKDMTERHMYITGATGVIHAGNEGYGEPYNIAPDDCYGESCCAIANSVWAHRLNRLYADASYMDQFEKIVYNTFLSAMAFNGQGMFYCNHVNRTTPDQRSWAGCPCCPGNVLSHYARIPSYVYSISDEGIYLNLFVDSKAHIPFGKGVSVTQQTEYPWEGKIAVEIDPEEVDTFGVFIRIPEWAESHAIRINGKSVEAPIDRGYALLERTWKSGDRIEIDFPMEARRAYMPEPFSGYDGLVALRRGPIVYTFEGIDNFGTVCNLLLPVKAPLKSVKSDILGGIVQIEATGRVLDWDGRWINRKITAIPSGLYSNRGTSVHYVWIAEEPEQVKEPEYHMNALLPPPGL